MHAYDIFVMRFESNINQQYPPIPGLQRIFGIDQKKAEEIAQNLPRVVKHRVSLDIAAEYAEALSEIGAEVQLRPCQDDSNLSQSTPPASRVSMPSSPPARGVDEPDAPQSQDLQSAPQLNQSDDGRVPQSSTQPSPDAEAFSQDSSQPRPLEQQEQNANRAEGIASPPATAPQATNHSQDVAAAWPNPNRSAFDANPNQDSASAARSTSAAVHATSPFGYSSPSSPLNTATTDESLPAEALKKSFWAPGVGYVLAGSVLIFIGLTYNGSIFTGNASITDYFFDALGLYWIAWGLIKLLRKRDGQQFG